MRTLMILIFMAATPVFAQSLIQTPGPKQLQTCRIYACWVSFYSRIQGGSCNPNSTQKPSYGCSANEARSALQAQMRNEDCGTPEVVKCW